MKSYFTQDRYQFAENEGVDMRAKGFMRFLAERRGATAIEYGLIISIMVVGLLAAMQHFKTANDEVYDNVEAAMVDAHTQ